MYPNKSFTLSLIHSGWDDLLQKISKVHKCQKTACRALHRLIESSGVTLPLPLDAVQISVKRTKPRVEQYQAWWPFITMRTWATYLLENHPKALLVYDLNESSKWRKMLDGFWSVYAGIDPQHMIFSSTLTEAVRCPTVSMVMREGDCAKFPF